MLSPPFKSYLLGQSKELSMFLKVVEKISTAISSGGGGLLFELFNWHREKKPISD
jgi:hypothetical protein